MSRRKLEELNLIDNFMFGVMVTHPQVGEDFARELLRIIFRMEFGRLTVIPQRVYYGADTDKHGARLDVYLEGEVPGGDDLICDLEPELKSAKKADLPKRVRFYHAKIDAHSLQSGQEYVSLKRVCVVMITNYDPFDRNRMVYTIRNNCVEEPDMPYDDGAVTLFLYTKGTAGGSNNELRQLLQYMEHTTEEYAANDTLRKMHQMVQKVKQDEEVSLEYMKVAEWEEWIKEQATKEGLEQGFKQGKEEGLEQGLEQGLERGIEQGIKRAQSEAIRNLMISLKLTAAQAMNALNIPASERETYAAMLKQGLLHNS